MTTHLQGKVSWFGGPQDTGVSPSEGLAFIYEVDDAPHLFLPKQPAGTTGLARRLDPQKLYIACRWDYEQISKEELLEVVALVRSPKTGREFFAAPADWGPHGDTNRVADISPGLMEALGIQTDDEIEVTFPYPRTQPGVPVVTTYSSVVISSGHGKYVRGASGIIDEVDEARKVVEHLADELDARGVEVIIFHDDTSKSQNENLNTIVNYHNSKKRQLDVSVHFNAYEQVTKPMGCEVLYVSQGDLAGRLSEAIAKAGGFINRGAKKRTDLFFLNQTHEPSVLLEVCFVDSQADTDLYKKNFDAICDAIAEVLGGPVEDEAHPPSPISPPPSEVAPPTVRIDIEVSGQAIVVVNGIVVS